MASRKFVLLTSVLIFIVGVLGLKNPSVPSCVRKCWDNSKFVTSCRNETKCLCEDDEFQNAIYQCITSQCQTSQLGSALHFALSECYPLHIEGTDSSPALIRHDHLRKRYNPNHRYMSAHASATASAYHRYGSASAAYSRPTRSVGHSANLATYSRGMSTVLTSLQDDAFPTPTISPTPSVSPLRV